MARKEIIRDPETEITSDVTGRTITVKASETPAPVKITIEGTADGKPYKKVLSGLDFLPTEWDGLREFAEMTDHSENPLLSFFAPVKSASNGSGGKKASERLQHARAWAKSQGKEVGEKGRVPAEILTAYDAAKPEGHIPADAA